MESFSLLSLLSFKSGGGGIYVVSRVGNFRQSKGARESILWAIIDFIEDCRFVSRAG